MGTSCKGGFSCGVFGLQNLNGSRKLSNSVFRVREKEFCWPGWCGFLLVLVPSHFGSLYLLKLVSGEIELSC